MNDLFHEDWQRSIGGGAAARARWLVDGGDWVWRGDGVHVTGTGPEWIELVWRGWDTAAARALRNFAVEGTVSGKAGAAGFSFGAYKDFLADVGPDTGPRRLRLEIDGGAGCWVFRVDGVLMNRCWWDEAVRGADDLLGDALRLKVRYAERVAFHDLAVHALEASCQLSVIVPCSRFLQRLRVTLRGWCHQDLPTGAYEVLVVNPASPDGTHEYLAAVANSYPHVRVREVAVGPDLARNKGAMINRAARLSRGPWVWLTDADCLFPPGAGAAVLAHVRGRPPRLFYGERRHLGPADTDALIAGRLDPVRDFEALGRRASPRPPEHAPWGYTQIVSRAALEHFPYQEGFNHFAHSDGAFVEACKRRGLLPEPVDGLFCLHLDHPFAWYGTDKFL
jgi:hypothetical protein